MIRIETDSGWILVEHPEHARLAGRFALHWGNAEFAAPEPRSDVMTAVARHDDAWAMRDALPFVTREGRPSAFSRELVGKYSAFEEIDMADYLAVRGRAADVVAAENPYAAVLISMHTVSLLTTHVDLSGLSAADVERHRLFIENQKGRQSELIAELAGDPARFADIQPGALDRAFKFLQACDSLSLGACVRFPEPKALRHAHPRRDGSLTEILMTPLGNDTYRLSPYPLDQDEVILELPCRAVSGKMFPSLESFRSAYLAAPLGKLKVRLVR
ncbi:MAG TPA: DUF3891 family protein [Opitutaceae bacterium]|jgi:hypothetical protein|nr:DUF3891 family protein [Opitutaceae bacterium]